MKKIGIVVLMILLISSCDKKRVFEENVDFSDYKWNNNMVLKFNVPINDSLSSHSIFFTLRHNNDYPYRNIIYFLTVNSPSGKTLKDTISFMMADEKGKWYGQGLAGVWNNMMLYKSNIRFPQNGKYTFQIEQAMRSNELSGLLDAGIRIEKE